MVLTPLLLFVILGLSAGSRLFDVYRLFQFDQGAAQFGSRRSVTDQLAATTSVNSEKLSKFILLIQAEEFIQTPDLIQRVCIFQNLADPFQLVLRQVSGLLIIFPGDPSQDILSAWKPLEQALATTFLDFPVWFAFSSPELQLFYQELQREEQSGDQVSHLFADSFRLSVPPPEGSQIKAPQGFNIQVHKQTIQTHH